MRIPLRSIRKQFRTRLQVEQLEDRIVPAWVNHAPVGADNTVTLLEDTSHVFQVGDFGYTDPQDWPANKFQAVRIVNLPGAGTLINDDTPVNAGDFVNISDILLGKFSFQAAPDANGTAYAQSNFQVQDDGGTAFGGVDLDARLRLTSLITRDGAVASLTRARSDSGALR